MGNGIDDPLADQCGNCIFWDKVPNHPAGNVGECVGVPPTPVVLGARPKQFGRPGETELQVELIRPVMATNARPCALHKRGLIPLFGKGPVSALGN